MSRYALETVGAFATAPGAAFAAMAAVTGDSLRIRDSKSSWLVDVLGHRQAAGSVRITSPLLHDNVVGITHQLPTGRFWLQHAFPQPLTPQDTLTLQAIGSATAGDIENNALQVYYEDLAGVQANLITPDELKKRAIEWFCPRTTITTAGTQGWTGTVAITALDDALKANQLYAWIGCTESSAVNNCGMLGMVSPDWGNLRIAAPFNQGGGAAHSTDYFVQLSSRMNMPCIPVFNASQKSNILMTVLGNENAEAVTVGLNLVRIKPVGAK